jgi:nucleotide-binding universal stress UspA family protein
MRSTIVAGLGGGNGWHALAWAADEATATGGRLVLCHACPADSPLAGRGPNAPIGLLELVDPQLARAVASARTRLGGNRVVLHVRPGRAEAVLLEAARDADLLVVGGPGRGRIRGVGSTTHHVAAHAPCPVVVARPVGDAGGPFAGHVVIGVADTDAGRAALEFGFGHADVHRRPVAAVRVAAHVDQDYWYDETTLSTHFAAEPGDLRLLATEVEPWMRKYPQVQVKRGIFTGQPLPGLLRAARGAPLLVVGDHGHGRVMRALLGTVSDGAVHSAGGPVAVVHGLERRGGTL